MAINHAKLSRDITALLTQEGGTVTFTAKGNDNINKATGELYSPQASAQFSGKAVRASYKIREVDGVSILAGDFKLICSALSTEPAPGMTATFFEDKYQVVSVLPIKPLNVVIAYIIQVRK